METTIIIKPEPIRKPLRWKRPVAAVLLLLAVCWIGRLALVRQMILPRLVLHQPVAPLKPSLRWPDTVTVSSVAISPDGSKIFSGSNFAFADPADKNGPNDMRGWSTNTPVPICVWNAHTGKLLQKLDGHRRLVNALACSLDGRLLASSGWDSTIRLWDIKTGRQIWARPGNTPALAFSPDNRSLAIDADIWRISDGKLMHTYNPRINQEAGIAFSPNGRTFACITGDYNEPKFSADVPLNIHVTGQRVQLWDVATGKLRLTLPNDLTQGIAFSPDSRWIVSLNRVEAGINLTDGASLHYMNTQTGQEKWVWSLDYHQDNEFIGMSSLTISPNGKWIIGEAVYHDFYQFRASDGVYVRRLHPLEWSDTGASCTTPSGLGFSQDGKTLVGRGRNTVQVWDTSTLR